jgi:hypothetical protein
LANQEYQKIEKILDRIQTQKLLAKSALVYLLRGLIIARVQSLGLKLAKPDNLPIRIIISYLDKHFTATYSSSGAAHLPHSVIVVQSLAYLCVISLR